VTKAILQAQKINMTFATLQPQETREPV